MLLFPLARRAAITLGAAMLTMATPALADANLNISPLRFELDARAPNTTLTLFNNGDEAGTFAIEFVEMEMDENGQLNPVEEGTVPANSLAELVRYAPRRVTLAPGTSQTVRLGIRRDALAGMADGEYRSHLQVRTLVGNNNVFNLEQPQDDGMLGIQVQVSRAIAVPFVFRKGELAAELTLDSPALVPASGEQPAQLKFDMVLAGNRSVHGNTQAVWVSPDGKREVIGELNAISLFLPQTRATRTMNLSPDHALPSEGTIEISFTEKGADEPMTGAILSL